MLTSCSAPGCEEHPTANGKECPRHFLERLRTIRVDTQNFDTAEHRDYYDPEPIRHVFGEDSKQRMLDETAGYGYAKSTLDGHVWHRDRRTGDVLSLRDDELESVYLGATKSRENR